MKTILITGASGYIGSHISLKLLENNFQIVAIDNLSNSNKKSLSRVTDIIGKKINFYHVDVRDKQRLRQIFEKYKVDLVLHLAGLKSVASSIINPIEYYDNNVLGSIILFELMQEFGINKIVFSSSATVYGDKNILPIKEDQNHFKPLNPYGKSKKIVEDLLGDIFESDKSWSIMCLRYFNPVGAHESGMIGEDLNFDATNLLPIISKVALGKIKNLKIYGNDYKTKDGTGVRDYIHIDDLANGHILAINKCLNSSGHWAINLGTGNGYSVFEVLKSFEVTTGIKIPYEIVSRREGDIETSYTDPSFARLILNWEAKKSLDDMCSDAWRWYSLNPNGFND